MTDKNVIFGFSPHRPFISNHLIDSKLKTEFGVVFNRAIPTFPRSNFCLDVFF
ncbi:hypothetical protein FD04_GL001292 [Secundilactobacillus odoratitofui DSM 19909 = JCM 15043]|uniref:Uncharacterized protein n=1 Tax=Secundilactobacillus odoratitofui DSM 19909 = JCM 15043 TaxID=1423776 RepID=A0A0R1M330_9LACO|nr:hypothetical protein FD04_GL001292 [Secundilactobacillus odoratitofui DSM 19909 = JCM 15043]